MCGRKVHPTTAKIGPIPQTLAPYWVILSNIGLYRFMLGCIGLMEKKMEASTSYKSRPLNPSQQ